MKHTFVLAFSLLLTSLFATSCERSDSSSSSGTGASGGAGGTAASAPTTGSSSASGAGKRIAVIPKGTTHVFWKSVEAGARKAAGESGVEMIWKGPLKEDDRAEQIKVVEQFVSEGVNGIVLAPLDKEALARPVSSAMGRNIPVV